MRQIYSTTLRLNLADPEERRAYEHLRRLDRKKYHSVSKAVVAAVNAYFGRLERLDADPYLETREKEDAFLQRVLTTLETGLRSVPVAMFPLATAALAAPETDGEDMEAALDFADSF